MLKQKEAVIKAVKDRLPNFVLHQDEAVSQLTHSNLEAIKAEIANGIINSQIEYSKDITNKTEVVAYARSMVMNHLKKAKELNGNRATGNTVAGLAAKKEKEMGSIDMNILPEDLKAYINKLV